jgi:hypothetical protein
MGNGPLPPFNQPNAQHFNEDYKQAESYKDKHVSFTKVFQFFSPLSRQKAKTDRPLQFHPLTFSYIVLFHQAPIATVTVPFHSIPKMRAQSMTRIFLKVCLFLLSSLTLRSFLFTPDISPLPASGSQAVPLPVSPQPPQVLPPHQSRSGSHDDSNSNGLFLISSLTLSLTPFPTRSSHCLSSLSHHPSPH